MIVFKKLSYKNFQTVGNHPMVIELDRSPTTVIGGHNGSGKSTVLEALVYCLYGKPLKKVKLAGLINSVNKKGLETSVEFENRGHTYRVVRGQKPAKFEIYKDGDPLDQNANSKDYQARLEKILEMDYKLFTQVVVLNKERYVPFMEMDGPSRRKIVEDILDISVFSAMSDIAKKEFQLKDNELRSAEREFLQAQAACNKFEELIAQAKKMEAARSTEYEEHLETIKEEARGYKRDLEGIELKDSVQDQVNSLLKSIRDYENACTKLKTMERGFLKNEEFYTNNSHCPECSQPLEGEVVDRQLTTTRDKIVKIGSKLDTAKNKIVELQSELDPLVEAERNRTLLMNEVQRAEQNLERLKREGRRLVEKIEGIKNKPEVDTTEYENSLAASKQSETQLEQKITNIGLELDVLDACKALLKDNGLKADIVVDYIDFMNETVNEYLNAMEFYINISIDQNFKDSINAVNKDGFTYDNLSSGQKCRVNLAIWLTLLEIATLKNSVVTNVLFLDEILEPVDKEGVQLVMKLFKEKMKGKNVFVVTQRFDEFEDHFRSSLRFKLTEGFTEKL